MQYSKKSVLNLVSHIHTLSQDFINLKLRELDLSELSSSHGNILWCLSQKGEMTLGELSAQINRDKSTTTVLVRKLEKAGFIELKKDDFDSRKKIITLTDAGRKYTKATGEISRKLLETAWEGFSEGDQEKLVELLSKLSGNLEG